FVDDVFTVAGKATNGVLWICTLVPADWTTGNFAARYQARFQISPPFYAAEAYDAATVLLSGIAAGKSTRGDLLAWVNRYDATGVSKHIRFKPNGDLSTAAAWVYRIAEEQYIPQMAISDVAPPAR